jgi:hypothetical protein
MHQLTDDWATKDKYRTGEHLKTELFISMKKLLDSQKVFMLESQALRPY